MFIERERDSVCITDGKREILESDQSRLIAHMKVQWKLTCISLGIN